MTTNICSTCESKYLALSKRLTCHNEKKILWIEKAKQTVRDYNELGRAGADNQPQVPRANGLRPSAAQQAKDQGSIWALCRRAQGSRPAVWTVRRCFDEHQRQGRRQVLWSGHGLSRKLLRSFRAGPLARGRLALQGDERACGPPFSCCFFSIE